MKTMNRIVLASAVLLSAAMPLSALAAPPANHTPKFAGQERTTTGAIATVSATEVKLANGETFKLSPGVSAASYRAGDKVQLHWKMKDGARLADRINAAKN